MHCQASAGRAGLCGEPWSISVISAIPKIIFRGTASSFVNHNNPPFEVKNLLKRSQSIIKNVNLPGPSRIAGSGTDAKIGDITINCTHGEAGPLAGKEERQVFFHNLCVSNVFIEHRSDDFLLGELKLPRNEVFNFKSDVGIATLSPSMMLDNGKTRTSIIDIDSDPLGLL